MAKAKRQPRATRKLKTAARDDKRRYALRIVVDQDKAMQLDQHSNLGRLGDELSRLRDEGRVNYGYAVNACKHIFGLGLNVLSDLRKLGVWDFAPGQDVPP